MNRTQEQDMTDKFGQFVKKKQDESSAHPGGKLDLEREKAVWLGKLTSLYQLVHQSLEQYLADDSIFLRYPDLQISEELLGAYTVQEAHITIGREVVHMTPLGTFLVGARGGSI
jgi:hypothetical protein